jgi:hypothetical protein
MSLNEIQQAIENLPAEQQARLVAWLSERDRRHWDLDLAQDFSPGGAGMPVLDRVRAQVASGESKPMAQGRQRR